ncbi:MAG: hypothetical protein GXP13_02805 [Gammaproteobacteria bacterium]|nr:hypothetical protein [Gammaproteobacteria bacterium]
MSANGLPAKGVLKTLFYIIFVLLVSGCSTHHWVSDAYPDGNSDLGRSLYSDCLKKVSKSVKEAAVPGYTSTPLYVPGKYGGVISMGSRTCSADCRKAQAIKAKITDNCMKENGNWEFIKKK